MAHMESTIYYVLQHPNRDMKHPPFAISMYTCTLLILLILFIFEII